MNLTIKKIATLLQCKVQGKDDSIIRHISTIHNATIDSITFLSNTKYTPYLYSTKASAVIVPKNFIPTKLPTPTLLFVEDPYTSLLQLAALDSAQNNLTKTGIETPSYISQKAIMEKGGYRGAFSYIGDHAVIGKNVQIYPHAYIGDGVQIGDNTIIYSGVKIYSHCIIGRHCIIHAGAVIGNDGFGFLPEKDGTYTKIPQLGKVIIKDQVEIGANSTIACATIDATVIEKGVKIDNLVHIAHNVTIGKNCAIAAQSGIAGSTKIGEGCVLAGQVGVVGHIEIGNNTTIAAQAGITKSFPKGNITLLGYPAFDHKKYLTAYAIFKNLPSLEKRLQQLEKKITIQCK